MKNRYTVHREKASQDQLDNFPISRCTAQKQANNR